MATEIYVNIKDLPELTEIGNGDYILVETSTGTHTINFENFLMPTDNTVITTVVEQNAVSLTNTISSVSLLDTKLSLLSTNIDEINTSLGLSDTDSKTKIDLLSANLSNKMDNLSSEFSKINYFIKNEQVTIYSGKNYASVVLFYGRSDITKSNILITPVDEYSARCPVYIEELNVTSGMLTIKTLTASVTQDAYYNVFVIKGG